ncbi:MAG: DEAD/DEAH box helicase, partial [Prolixibacteraceae bacterium]|nr:DEAD/DEAH box helicase [Prolixibacteraceae bacterium]
MRFEEFDLNDDILEAISYMGFEKASPIQEKAIPAILENKDVLAFAQTGTGKTAAFLLPILNKIAHSKSKSINTLIIVPTRELAIQIDQQIQGFSYFIPTNSIAIYGGGDGSDFTREKNALSSNSDIVVATPGKLISHLNLGYVKFDQVEHLILDEADRMLDMGFNEDIQRIISYLPKKRQTLFFSATMPPKIKLLAKAILHNPEEIIIELSKPAKGVLQAVYLTKEEQKKPLINQLIANNEDYKSILIFTSTKVKVNQIVQGLKNKNYIVRGISSDLEQKQREEVLSQFRSKRTRVLVATDVLSRGIDIKDINLIVNYDVPNDAEDYVHRVGRTARADTEGVALTLVNEADMYKIKQIESLIGDEIMKLPLPA